MNLERVDASQFNSHDQIPIPDQKHIRVVAITFQVRSIWSRNLNSRLMVNEERTDKSLS